MKRIKHWIAILTGEEPPYNTWIPYQDWCDANWRRHNLEIVEYNREKKLIKVAPWKDGRNSLSLE